MAFCSKCGARLDDQIAFCPQCGQARSAAPSPAAGATQAGLPENVSGALCYALWWVTGIIFLVIDNRPSVRFHAAQSIVVFGAFTVANILLGTIFGGGMFFGGSWEGFSAGLLLATVVHLLEFVLWILCMVMAAQGKRFEVPFAAGIVQSIAGK
jgi:uncharacterized membrane protein